MLHAKCAQRAKAELKISHMPQTVDIFLVEEIILNTDLFYNTGLFKIGLAYYFHYISIIYLYQTNDYMDGNRKLAV